MPTGQSYRFDPITSHPPQHDGHWARLRCADLADLDDEAIRNEITTLDLERARRRLEPRLTGRRRQRRLFMLDDAPTDLEWLARRLMKLRAELTRRRHTA